MTSIKNWNQFQHFKDRRPPWIKLYRDLLDDLEWHQLDPVAAKVLVMLWLIASESGGNLPDKTILAFRLRMSEKDVLTCMNKLSHWLNQDDINAISTRYQDDSPETETETETKKEKKQSHSVAGAPESVDNLVWEDFLKIRKAKKAPMTATALEGIKREATKAGWTLNDAIRECVIRGWQGFKSDWVEARTVAGPDPGLAKLKEDEKLARPMPANIREMLQSAVKRMP
jgi:hypothetical protein